ncbi:MAG: T9SS type A sorting domain-containing protein [Bacteroidia bacterium]|nr:T9SS type A sorting domain-containing protein [Bacteroidia bacterium]
MRKIYTFSTIALLFVASALTARATVWNVIVQSSFFAPNTLPNVVCGDTIVWTLGSGVHTTTSTTIPSGATPWDAPIDGANLFFGYRVPNFPGVYNYVCTPHGFTGSFTVTCSVGIEEKTASATTLAYPNPFVSSFTFGYTNADAVRIINITGEVLQTIPLNPSGSEASVNMDGFSSGVYFYSTMKDGIILETRKIFKTK